MVETCERCGGDGRHIKRVLVSTGHKFRDYNHPSRVYEMMDWDNKDVGECPSCYGTGLRNKLND